MTRSSSVMLFVGALASSLVSCGRSGKPAPLPHPAPAASSLTAKAKPPPCRVVVPDVPIAATQWVTMLDRLPAPRSDLLAAIHEDRIFVMGGQWPPPPPALAREGWTTVLRGQALDAWQVLPPLDTTYQNGGFAYAGWIYSLDPPRAAPIEAGGTLGQWQQFKGDPLGNGHRASVRVVDGHIYDIGSWDNGRDVWVGSIANGAVVDWKKTSALPGGRAEAIAVGHGGYLYSFGGVLWPLGKKEPNGSYDVKNFRWYDEVLRAKIRPDGTLEDWTIAGEFVSRERAAVAVIGDEIVVVGGSRLGGIRDEVIAAHFEEDGSVTPWRTLGSYGRFEIGAYVVHGSDFVFFADDNGGSDKVRMLSLERVVSCTP